VLLLELFQGPEEVSSEGFACVIESVVAHHLSCSNDTQLLDFSSSSNGGSRAEGTVLLPCCASCNLS
jgi:hypothetical protein